MSTSYDPLAVLELLEDAGAPYAVRVAAYLDPACWAAAHTDSAGPGQSGEPSDPADPADVNTWVAWVAAVTRILRGAGFVGVRAPREATTLLAVTGLSEGRLLIDMAETYGRPDVAEVLGIWLAQLHARDAEGRPLVENPTDAHAVVVHLTDRPDRAGRRAPTSRRTS